MTEPGDSVVFEVGDIVAVRWMEETVFATIKRIDEKGFRWLAIPGVKHLAAYRDRELELAERP